jgi:outer membrane protein assembly factor BamD (BamD/ComL family)
MSVSAIFPSSTLSQINNPQNANQQRRTEFQELTKALQSGNLTNAQQAFGSLTNSAASSGLQSVKLTQDLNALGSALQSGNLTGARNAYSAVQQSLQNSNPMAAHHHHPHHGGGGSRILTSGFPDGTGNSGISTGSQSEAFQPVNLTA